MDVTDLRLKGLKLISSRVYLDDRGFFKETYQEEHYKKCGIVCGFVQDNFSFSQNHVIRGMHFQSRPGQAKLISVYQGKIFDVAVDLRTDSPTFGQWEGVYLDSHSHQQLFIPNGFAHGFCVMSPEGAHVHYKVSTPYDSTTEKSFRYNDPFVKIAWPLTAPPILSSRDLLAPLFHEAVS